MGGLTTSLLQENIKMNSNFSETVKLDWVSFTVENTVESMDKLRGFFDDMGIEERDFGGMGYDHSVSLGENGAIYWSETRSDMGIHVRLPAQTLSAVETTPIGLIRRVIDWDGKFTRLDIAFDDFDGLLDIDEMHRKIKAGELVTRWRKVKRIDGGKVGDDEKTGDTINIGSRSSESFLRIYDKKLETEARGKTVENIDNWVRVEIELKGEKSDVFSRLLADTAVTSVITPAVLCSELLYGLIDFKETDFSGDTNKSRWETSDWWRDFIQVSSKLTLSLPKTEKTLDDSKNWVKKAVSSTLGMIVLSKDDDKDVSGYDFIMSCIIMGADKMSKTQRRRLNLYNRQQEQNKEGSALPI